jgi:uncharacterized protein YndB with AHSA1/START domain
MTTYTIKVFNQSGANKSYVLFTQPPGVTTPVYTNAWATFDNIHNDGWDSLVFTPEPVVQGKTVKVTPAPRILVSEGAYTPGQVFTPAKGAKIAVVDFTGLPNTTATVTEHPDGGFSVVYD